jgi:pyridoxal phosphate enzyme (YggS family)
MTSRQTAVDALRAAHEHVLERIAAACARAGRDAGDVTLVAVSKEVEARRIGDAVQAGIRTFGENRVQEAMAKRPETQFPDVIWHLVGPLQSNKAKRALETFDVIETVDSVSLAERLNRLAGEVRGASPAARYPVLAQVNVDDDPSKAGFQPAALAEALARIGQLETVEVRGLMTIGRLVDSAEAARPTFAALRELSARLRDGGAALGSDLSMGMTDDFEVAVEEGATIVRVGRAIFGERPHHHGPDDAPHRHGTTGPGHG